MAVKVEKLDGNRAKLEITVSPEIFEESVERAYRKNKGKYVVHGFRKGKVPRKIIENLYGPQEFYEDALQETVPTAYMDAVKESELDVVSKPNYSVQDISPEKGVVFTATVALKPDVKLGDYEGIKVTKVITDVTDEMIDEEIEKVREQNARWVDMDRAAQIGDTVTIDFSGTIDGVKFGGGSAENQTLVLGENRFIPGFEEQIVGIKPGEEKDITVTFPSDYTPDLADKEAVFRIAMKTVKEKELADLDDEFAQDVSEFDTMEEYRKDVKEQIEKRLELQQKAQMESQLIEGVTAGIETDIPEEMIETRIDTEIDRISYQLMYQGIHLEDYLKYTNQTMDDLRKELRETAISQIRLSLAIEELMKELKIDPTDKEVEARYKELADAENKTVEEYKDGLSAQEVDSFKDRVAFEQLFDILTEKAEIEEIDVEEAKRCAEEAAKDAEKEHAAEQENTESSEEEPVETDQD